jgi:hypothetical protein
MSATIVRYRVKPGRAEENAALVRAVYSELAALGPAGFRYATFVMEDGVSFVHIAILDDDHDEAPLTGLAAFARFREGLADRCEEGPQTLTAPSLVASFGL